MLPKLMTAVLILIAIAHSPALAETSRNTDAKAILAQQQEIREQVTAKKGRYRGMSEANRTQLIEHQDRVHGLLTEVSDTTQLREHDQIALFNSLEAIQGIVNQAEDERLVCERYKPAGSNRPVTVCKSVAQRRAEKQDGEDAMRRNQICTDGWNSDFCKN